MVKVTTAPIEQIRSERSSIKWTRFPADVLPLFVAEMDYGIAAPVVDELVRRVRASDVGYLDGPGPLAPAFSRFASDRWGWTVDERRVHIASDVSVGIVETLRLTVPRGGQVVVTPPVYPPFFELVEEAGAALVEVPLIVTAGRATLDLTGLERAFEAGAPAFLLCNPHNPMGLVHDRETLAAVARIAALHDVLVISDEVHAPLTHPGVTFTPFAAVAEPLGARSVCVTSASKGWNLAGAKCSLVIAGDERTARLLDGLVEEVACRTSILGLHANRVAFGCTDWLDDAIAQIVANDALLASLLAEQLPGVVYHRPDAGYLAWLDLRPLGLGADPAAAVLEHARVALNAGHVYGRGGAGHARLNLACDPSTLHEAVRRIAALVSATRVDDAPSGPAALAPPATTATARGVTA